jgi:hypothetical protein
MTKESFNDRDKRELDQQLDKELEDTFAASDPLTITRFPRKRRSEEKPQMGSNTDRLHPAILATCDIEQARSCLELPPRRPLRAVLRVTERELLLHRYINDCSPRAP